MKHCHECQHYNRGSGGKQCLSCHKYTEIIRNSAKRKTIPIDVIPQHLLEAIADDSDNRINSILDAIRTLPPQLSAIISMIYISGLTHRQVASILHIPPGSIVKKNKFALEIIKKTLE